MKVTRFVPDSFIPKDKDIAWAMENFGITRQEANRQLEEFRDHEFRRDYTDWNKCFRNWFRSADKYDLLKREHKPRLVEEVSEEQLQRDRAASWADIERLRTK